MIQRIQSVFLVLATVFLFASLFFNIAEFSSPNDSISYSLNLLKFSSADQHELTPPLLVRVGVYAVALLLVLNLFSVFQYKKIRKQLQFVNLNFILTLAFLVLVFLTPDQLANTLNKSYTVKLGIAYYLPIAAIVCQILAIRFIKKDIALIQSADRLR